MCISERRKSKIEIERIALAAMSLGMMMMFT
jgi:hypothetical protein